MEISRKLAAWLSTDRTLFSLSPTFSDASQPRCCVGSRGHKIRRTIEAIKALWPDGNYPCEDRRYQEIKNYFVKRGWSPPSRRTITSAMSRHCGQ